MIAHRSKANDDNASTVRPLHPVSCAPVPAAQPAGRILSFRKERSLAVRSAVQYGAGGAAKVDALAALLGMARGRVARCLSPHYPDAFSDAQIATLVGEWPVLGMKLGVESPARAA